MSTQMGVIVHKITSGISTCGPRCEKRTDGCAPGLNRSTTVSEAAHTAQPLMGLPFFERLVTAVSGAAGRVATRGGLAAT